MFFPYTINNVPVGPPAGVPSLLRQSVHRWEVGADRLFSFTLPSMRLITLKAFPELVPSIGSLLRQTTSSKIGLLAETMWLRWVVKNQRPSLIKSNEGNGTKYNILRVKSIQLLPVHHSIKTVLMQIHKVRIGVLCRNYLVHSPFIWKKVCPRPWPNIFSPYRKNIFNPIRFGCWPQRTASKIYSKDAAG